MTPEGLSDDMDWSFTSPATSALPGLPHAAALPAPAALVDVPVTPVTTSTPAPVLAPARAPAPAVESPVAPFPSSLAPTPSPPRALAPLLPAAEDSSLARLEAELEAELMKDDEISTAMPVLAPVFNFSFSLAGAPAAPTAFGFGEKVAAPERVASPERVATPERVASVKVNRKDEEEEIYKSKQGWSPCALSDELPDSDEETLNLDNCVPRWGSIPSHFLVTPTPASKGQSKSLNRL